MSNKEAKSRRSKHKDSRQTPAEDGPSTGKRRKRVDKPWEVVMRSGIFAGMVFHRAATQELAETWVEKHPAAMCVTPSDLRSD